jgi:hypothetical protein
MMFSDTIKNFIKLKKQNNVGKKLSKNTFCPFWFQKQKIEK